MRNRYIIVIALFLLAVGACDDNESVLSRVLPSEEGNFTDQRDGSVYHWVRYGDLEWMTENMRVEVENGESQIYSEIQITPEERKDQEAQNCIKYGYLYDYEAAQEAVPEGWRIPTDEDWQKLEKLMGMSESELSVFGWRGDRQGEMLQQKEMLWLRPGGFVNYEDKSFGSYTPDFLGFYGFFWSSSEDTGKQKAIIYRQICYNTSQIGRFSTLPEKLLSVRCVRDVSK